MSKYLKIYPIYLIANLIPIILYAFPVLQEKLAARPDFSGFLLYFPYVSIGFIGLAGFKYNQARLFTLSLLLAFGYYCVINPDLLLGLGMGKIRLRQIFSLAFPLGITLIFLTKENPAFHKRSLLQLAGGFFPLIFFSCFFMFYPYAFSKFVNSNIFKLKNIVNFPQYAIIGPLIYSICLVAIKDKRTTLFKMALLFCFISFFFSVHVGIDFNITKEKLILSSVISFLVISCVLLHAIFHMYWQKTYFDELTGIPNRRALEERLPWLSGKYSVAMIDIDHFKKFNDTYNHETGDRVLRFIANLLSKHIDGQIYRYGGEEFCVIFYKMDSITANQSAESARKILKQQKIPISLKNGSIRKVSITISIGIAQAKINTTPQDVIKEADHALYKAKKTGRNKIVKAA
ncbi:MAG: GGDEF domain-containing protein [Halobacteriovoraceae bacterium]|nr:GGDEF domain-containing protein [Halobacteriovoraceae bacterium]